VHVNNLTVNLNTVTYMCHNNMGVVHSPRVSVLLVRSQNVFRRLLLTAVSLHVITPWCRTLEQTLFDHFA